MEQVMHSGVERGAPGVLVPFLAWVDARPRTYGETMDAWRTSCPRLSMWDDTFGKGLVTTEAGVRQGESVVRFLAARLVRLGAVARG